MNSNNNAEDILGLLNRLPALLRWAGMKNFGSNLHFTYVAPSAQYVHYIDTQIFGEQKAPTDRPCKGADGKTKKKDVLKENAPLSALFRKDSHEELKKVITAWQPFLSSGTAEDVLTLSVFQFDLSRIQPSTVYLDLAQLISQGGLRCSMSILAAYMYTHSNLSRSENALYVQLKRYKKLSE
jgi:hypothetical protein